IYSPTVSGTLAWDHTKRAGTPALPGRRTSSEDWKRSWFLQVTARVGGGEWAGQPARGREDSSAGGVSRGGAGASVAVVGSPAPGSPGWDASVPGRPVPDLLPSCSVFRCSGVRVFRCSVLGCSGEATA